MSRPPSSRRSGPATTALQSEVDRLRAALKQVGSIPALKYLLGRCGFAFGEARLPGSTLSAGTESRAGRPAALTHEKTGSRF